MVLRLPPKGTTSIAIIFVPNVNVSSRQVKWGTLYTAKFLEKLTISRRKNEYFANTYSSLLFNYVINCMARFCRFCQQNLQTDSRRCSVLPLYDAALKAISGSLSKSEHCSASFTNLRFSQ